MEITLFKRSVRFSWLAFVAYLIVVTLLCSLGFWQLDRSEQKRRLVEQQQHASDLPRIDLNKQPVTDIDSVRYRSVVVRGRYDVEHQFLLDNQIMDGKTGYFVLTPFFVDKQDIAVLINRGWVPLGSDRFFLPDVGIQFAQVALTGRINTFPQVGIKLKGAEIPTDSWPAVVQVVDELVLSEKLAYPLAAYQIELDATAKEGFRREWKTVTPIPPEKHVAYAVQWFGLALTLTVLFIWIGTRKRSEHTT